MLSRVTATSYVPKYIVVLKAILFFPVAWETPFKNVLEVIREVHNCTHCINVKMVIVAMVIFCCFCTPYHMGINEQIQQEKIRKINLIEYHESKIDKMPWFVNLIAVDLYNLRYGYNMCLYSGKLIATIFDINCFSFLWIRFRVLFVHMLPCLALVVLNILLFLAMFEADRKRERLLKTRMVSTTSSNPGSTSTNNTKSVGGESKETKKIRDTNNTTLMLVVVITVNILCYLL